MPITNCRGEEKRIQQVRDFSITPLTHIQLLEGQTQKSCAGPKLDREYYVFSYQHRIDADDKGTFICGMGAARHFIHLLQQQNPTIRPLPLFNPLTDLDEPGEGNRLPGAPNPEERQLADNWNLVAKDLYNAINMICIIWNLSNLGGALQSVLFNINANPNMTPRNSDIRSINTIIYKNFVKPNTPNLVTYFQEFLQKQKVTNARQIDFPHLTAHFIQHVATPEKPIGYFS